MFDSNKVYEYTAENGDVYCYNYCDPITRQNELTFNGIAKAWKKTDDPEKYFVLVVGYPDEAHTEVSEFAVHRGIEYHITGEQKTTVM